MVRIIFLESRGGEVAVFVAMATSISGDDFRVLMLLITGPSSTMVVVTTTEEIALYQTPLVIVVGTDVDESGNCPTLLRKGL